MSLLSSSIAPAAAPVASTQTQGSGSARGGNVGSALNPNNQAALNSQSPAAVVTVSADSKSRGASSGEGRKVDDSFEKQESKANAENKKNDGSQGPRASLDVAA